MKIKCIIPYLILIISLKPLFAANPPNSSKPNIIHIVADDVGYDDLSCFGSRDIKTPHLDKMAEGGISFTNFYAPHPSCTPSRAAMLTGRYAPRINDNKGISILWPNANDGLDPEKEIAIGHVLKEQGYATAVIGKWHLGDRTKYLPMHHGFDYYFGIPYPNDHGPERWYGMGTRELPAIPLIEDTLFVRRLDNNDLAEIPGEFTRKACKFIRDNAKSGTPFYLHFSNIETHTPWFVPKGFEGYSGAGAYGDAVEYLDRTVGIIFEQLRRLKITNNTLIVFSSDNGPLVQAYPELEACYGKYAEVDTIRGKQHILHEGKYQARYEGGPKVACIISWAGQIKGGLQNDMLVDATDLFTTFVNMAGGKIPEDRVIDGQDLSGILLNNETEQLREVFYSYQGNGMLMGVRYKNWKLAVPAKKYWAIEALKEPMLFDLSNDPKEQNNVAQQYPDILKLMIDLAEIGKSNIERELMLPRFVEN